MTTENPPYNKNVPASLILDFSKGNVNPTIASQKRLEIVEQLTLLSGENSGIISQTIGPNAIPKQKLSMIIYRFLNNLYRQLQSISLHHQSLQNLIPLTTLNK